MVPNFQPNLFRRHTEPLDLFCWAMLLLVMLLVCPLSLSSPFHTSLAKGWGEVHWGHFGPGRVRFWHSLFYFFSLLKRLSSTVWSFFCINNFRVFFIPLSSVPLSFHFLLNRVPTCTQLLLAFFITVCVWNVSSSIQNWCLRFFCIRAKLIHVFVSELLLLSSLSLLLLLSFAGTFLFSLITTTILVDHCVSGVNLCRRRSVAFVHRGKRTQKKNAPGIASNIGNVVGERCTFRTESRFFRVWRACVWSARGTTWHTVWRNRKCCPYLGPAWRCHVDSAGSHWAVVRAGMGQKIN